jgi:hypothetical protein
MKVRCSGRMAAVAALCCGTIFGAGSAVGQFAGPSVSSHSPGSASPISALTAQYNDVKIMPGAVIAIAT